MKLTDGTEYDGEFMNDQFHGLGKLTFRTQKKDEKGVVFEGQFHDGKQDRKGKLIYPDNSFYEG